MISTNSNVPASMGRDRFTVAPAASTSGNSMDEHHWCTTTDSGNFGFEGTFIIPSEMRDIC